MMSKRPWSSASCDGGTLHAVEPLVAAVQNVIPMLLVPPSGMPVGSSRVPEYVRAAVAGMPFASARPAMNDAGTATAAATATPTAMRVLCFMFLMEELLQSHKHDFPRRRR